MNAPLCHSPAPVPQRRAPHPFSTLPIRCALLGFGLLAGLTTLASIPEPGTVFYGKIVNRTSGQEYVLTEGTIHWTITKPDGGRMILIGRVEDFKNGEFSYRMTVPHEALALGLTVSTNSVPLSAQPGACSHVQIIVNDFPAKILAPGSQSFHVAQGNRAATHRLDLEMFDPLSDADGDGIPDWWENKYGLDRLFSGDATGDRDGDGLSNLAEFRAGSDPNQSNLTPSLGTRSLLVYADGTTSLRLKIIDSDSAPNNLTYTLLRAPANGAVVLRNASAQGTSSDRVLQTGATFAQVDVNRGRVIFTHDDTSAGSSSSSLELRVQDENPAHTASTGTVSLVVYRPGDGVTAATLTGAMGGLPAGTVDIAGVSENEQQKLANYLLSREMGYIIVDASGDGGAQQLSVPSSGLSQPQYETEYIPSYGRDRHHVLLGGASADVLNGSMESDVLIGGPGDDRLRGSGGSDLFAVLSPHDGNDTIEDFNVSDGDALDLSRVLSESSSLLSDYVRISAGESNSLIGIDFAGSASGYTNMVITLANSSFNQGSLHDLFENGNLIARGKWLPARVSVRATIATASENGPSDGEVTVSRTGETNAPLTVNLSITGSAVNGVDYQLVDSRVTIAAGARSVALAVSPYPDAVTESAEFVEVGVVAGTNYELGTTTTARVTIEDLAPQVSIEALEPIAEKASQTPGLFLVTRSGVLDRSVFVRLQISGTASNGVDYSRINAYVNLAAGQTSELIEIAPKTNAALQGGAESVVLSVKADTTYKTGNPSSARVIVVEEMLTLARWRERSFPTLTGDLGQFAGADQGGCGIQNVLRYGFGLDPQDPTSAASRAALPQSLISGNHFCVTFRRPTAVTDLEYVVEVSTDMRSWRSNASDVEEVLMPNGLGDFETKCYRAVRPMTQSPAQFLRVRVIYRP